jgi:serine/threonine-protein kinase RsbW
MKKEIILKNSLNETKGLEQFLESVADLYKISDVIYANMITAAMEAFNNAYFHGNKKDPSKTIRVTFDEQKDYFVLSIKDEGNGFDFEQQLKNIDENNGLFIILKVCDKVQFQDNGSLIEMIFYKQALSDEFFDYRKNIIKSSLKHGTKNNQKS